MPLGSGFVDEKDLIKIKSSKPNTILVIHHPIYDVTPLKVNEIGIENKVDIKKAINGNIKGIICGHGHNYHVKTINNIKQIMAPSISYGFNDKLEKTSNTGYLTYNYNLSDIQQHECATFYLNKI